jgi:predicted DNA-binding transcriptional regulator YafY
MFLRGQSLANRYADGAGVWCGVDIEDADAGVVPPIDSMVLSGFLRALAERSAIAIRYAGRESASDMVVSPQRLVHALHRYHVRCVDHRDGCFKDIVLSRVVSLAPCDADYLPTRDPEWGASVTLSFKVNPALSPAMNHSVHNEWRLARGASIELGCRVALAIYVTRRMTMPSTDGPARWIPADTQTAKFTRADPR